MSVAVITDSAASLPAELCGSLNITVVPIRTILNGEDVTEKEVPPQDLLAGEVSTAAPSPGDYARAAAEFRGDGGVIVCTVSSSLSGSYSAALAWAKGCTAPIEVVDSNTAACAQGLVVAAAARASLSGCDLPGVARAANEVARGVRLVGMLFTLDQLVRSGRIPAPVGRAGDHLRLRPIFAIQEGRIRRGAPALSPNGAYRRLLAQWRHSRPAEAARLHAAVSHALAPQEADSLLEAVSSECAPHFSFISDFPSPLLVSAGAGALGLAWWWEVPP